jgi:hypothetical protein
MPPHDRLDLARVLLARAVDDETLVRKVCSDADVADAIVGSHAQQAAEKLIKAVLAARGVTDRQTMTNESQARTSPSRTAPLTVARLLDFEQRPHTGQKRRGGDSNPRTRFPPLRDFQSRPFNRSGTSPWASPMVIGGGYIEGYDTHARPVARLPPC